VGNSGIKINVFESGSTKERIKNIPRQLKSKIKECKAAYKDKNENLFKDSGKAWQGLQTITGYKPKSHCKLSKK
jgi:hypothetical protein